MASQLPPSGRPWLLRLASQTGRADPQPEAPPTAPQQAPRPVGVPIRQASLALGRTPLFPTQPSQPPPPPPPPVATQPAPLRPSTVATNGSAVVTPTPPLAMPRRFPTPPPSPEPQPPKPVPEAQVKRIVDEQQPKKNGTAVEGIKNGGNGNSSPAAPFINSAAADQKDEKKYSPAPGKGWAMPTSPTATAANKQGAREMGGITIAGYNIGAFMDLGTSSSSSSFSHQIRRQQVRSTKIDHESDLEDATKSAEGKTKKPWPSMVNNNVQSVNNSLVFGARLEQGSPGVHVNLTKNRK